MPVFTQKIRQVKRKKEFQYHHWHKHFLSYTGCSQSSSPAAVEMNSCLWITWLTTCSDECSDMNQLGQGCHLYSLQEFLALYVFMAHQPPVGQGHLIVKDSRSYSDTTHSVGLLWISDQPVSETLPDDTQHSSETQPCPRWDSNPQSQKASCRRPTP
jgi:hypothetical protein